jgi:hypothetical protein
MARRGGHSTGSHPLLRDIEVWLLLEIMRKKDAVDKSIRAERAKLHRPGE